MNGIYLFAIVSLCIVIVVNRVCTCVERVYLGIQENKSAFEKFIDAIRKGKNASNSDI